MRSLALVVSLLLCLSCARAFEKQPAAAAPLQTAPRGAAIVDHSRPALTLDQVQPAEIPAAVDAQFRLMPDRRVLTAVSDINELSTGHKDPKVEIDFRNGAWQIRTGGQDVGSLPEIATFRDDLDMLSKWAASLRSQRQAASPLSTNDLAQVDKEIEAFAPANLFAALDLIAKETGAKALDPASAERAAHATELLGVQTFDWFELSDPLTARALALLAIAHAGSNDCCNADDALMAALLGYQKETQALSASLPQSSFTATYINDTDGGDSTGPSFQWLRDRSTMRKITDSDNSAAFPTKLDAQWATLLNEVHAFSGQVPVARILQSLILQEVETNRFNSGPIDPRHLDLEKHDPISRFERAIAARIHTVQNAVLGEDASRSYYESNFYAAIFKEFAFHEYSRYDRDALTGFIPALGKPASDLGSQVVAWMNGMSDATFDAAHATKSVDLTQSLHAMPLAGGWRRAELLQTWNRSAGTQTRMRKAAAVLYAELDSRPTQIYAAGEISADVISDPMRRERYISAAIERAPNLASWGETASYFLESGDRAALRDLAEHASNVGTRTNALATLAKLGDMDDAFVHRQFEDILKNSTSIYALSQYAVYLNERGEAATKERFMKGVLGKIRDHQDPITVAWVAASLANALDRQGKYAEAWTVIEPYIEVYSQNVLEYGASILQHLGRIDEANKLAAASVERYPGESSRGTFAEILWREGRFKEAAAELDPARAAYSVNDAAWDLPEKFDETFKSAPPAKAVEAYGELIAVHLNGQILMQIPEKARKEHHPELAFALVERLLQEPDYSVANHHPESIFALRTGYHALSDLKGPDAAIQWLDSNIPASAGIQALIVFYQDGEFDLVQRYASLVSESKKSNEVATLEAASLLMMRVPPTDSRWEKLNVTIRNLGPSENPTPMAKYLAGQIDERTFFASAKSTRNHSDIEYFAGVKAVSGSDYERALPLMVAASFAPDDYPPAAWALEQLYAWNGRNAPWQTIAKGEAVTAAP